MSVATVEQADRLSRAIRFRTVTIRVSPARAQPAQREFDGLNAYLRDAFPLVARSLEWVVTEDGALLLTWHPATEATAEGGVLFSAHTDVVPPGDESAWNHGPFSGDVADGFVWGRGCLDDKGPLLAILEAMESLLRVGGPPRRTVYLAVGCDEETEGRRGAGELARLLARRGARLDAVFDEGSFVVRGLLPFLRRPVAPVGIAEKGYADVVIRVTGDGGHASLPASRTAAGVLGGLVARLESRPAPATLLPVVRGFLATLGRHARGPRGLLLRGVAVLWPLVRGALMRDRSIAALLRTTRAVTILRGGEAENVIPERACAVLNTRILPGETVQGTVESIRRLATRRLPAGIRVDVRLSERTRACEPIPPGAASGPVWEEVRRALERAVGDVVVAPFLTPGLTDSRSYAGLCGAIYRVLPLVMDRGELGLVHGVDERISLENYGRMIGYYRDLIVGVAGQDPEPPRRERSAAS